MGNTSTPDSRARRTAFGKGIGNVTLRRPNLIDYSQMEARLNRHVVFAAASIAVGLSSGLSFSPHTKV